jgi:hypothetical protein
MSRPIAYLQILARENVARIPHLTEQALEATDLNEWLMREQTGRDVELPGDGYSLYYCGPDRPINDQHEKPLTELSPEVWEGILIGLCVLGVVTLWALIHYTPIFHTGHFPHVALWGF